MVFLICFVKVGIFCDLSESVVLRVRHRFTKRIHYTRPIDSSISSSVLDYHVQSNT